MRHALPLHSPRIFVALLGAVFVLHAVLLEGLAHLLAGNREHGLVSDADTLRITSRLIAESAGNPPHTPQRPREESPGERVPAAIPPVQARPPSPPVPTVPEQPNIERTPRFSATQDTQPAGTETRAPEATPVESPPAVQRSLAIALPPPAVVHYALSGSAGEGRAALRWEHDGSQYQASLTLTQSGKSIRQWSSKGVLGAQGIEPVRFGEKSLRRAEVAAHFVREEGRVIFSANAPPAALMPGAQDLASMWVQMAGLWAASPQRWAPGDTLSLPIVGPRWAEAWTFVVAAPETLVLAGTHVETIKLTREASNEYSTKAEVWLAPPPVFWPARIRLSEPRGRVIDLVWTDTQPPENSSP